MALLSAVLCVRNEEERLESCLRRLTFADEIVVLLDRCADSFEAALYPLISTLRARLESTQTHSPAAGYAVGLDSRLAEADL